MSVLLIVRFLLFAFGLLFSSFLTFSEVVKSETLVLLVFDG
jgi:hypothetical protein